jgi:ATP-dependent RNA helicase SUPV3L1/SUV3
LRAFLAPLAENGGVATRRELSGALDLLEPAHRHAVRGLGLTLGSLAIFHAHLLKPGAVALRLALIAVREGKVMPPLPMPGLGLLDRPSPELGLAAMRAGWFGFGTQMLRHDLVERIARAVHDQRDGHKPFVPDARLATSMGVGEETLSRVLRALGFVPETVKAEGPMRWRWRGSGRSTARPVLPKKRFRRRPRPNKPGVAQGSA